MKKLINNRYANYYLNAADKLGLKYKIINSQAALARIYDDDKSIELSANVLSLNSQLSAALATNKKKTSLLLRDENIPVPDFKTFRDPKLAEKYLLNKLKGIQTYVVKPLSGSLAIGITINPMTYGQVVQALKEAFEENSEIIIEKYIPGQHYRITVLDDEVIAITQRLPAYVVGDAQKTVEELIAEKNIKRNIRNLPPIILRTKDHNYLKTKKIKTSTICPEGEQLTLQLGCDMNIGGERKRIDRDFVPEINKDLFITAARTLDLRFAGIDYISPDITIPYTRVVSAINEINSAPHSDVHYRDTYPFDNYAAERIIEKIFGRDILNVQNPLLNSEAAVDIYSPFIG